jgi:hypothetical protein
MSGQAQESPTPNKYLSAVSEMNRLVAAKSSTREYLSCAVLSANLQNTDMYGLFVRKAGGETNNEVAFQMALAYMMGFFESEMLNMQGQAKSSREVGEVLGHLYASKCMKYILPRQP